MNERGAIRTKARESRESGNRFLRILRVWKHRVVGLGETRQFLLLAILIGLFSGLSVVCFRISIQWVRVWMLGSSLAPPMVRVVLAPTVAGLVVAVLVIHLFPRARGSGVNQTKAAVYVFDGYVPFRTMVGKFITCALAIGSGHSLGPEDPSLQMGAGIASLLGRKLNLSKDRLRLIAPVGAAAGLAAAFNAPISSVLFVIEEVIGTWSGGVLGAIVLAAVSSVVVMRLFLGGEPLFRIPQFRLESPFELLAYAVLGIAGGFASLLFLKIVLYLRPRLQGMPHWTQYLQPAAAGLATGIIGIWLPQVMGTGYPGIDQALHGEFAWKMLLLLGFAKILATSLSFSTGTPGGMFAPTLFVGAMIGGAVGGTEAMVTHHLHASVANFALVGMGTLFAGFLRVPITSVFMVVEITGNYSIILPVMISNLLAYFISRRYQKIPLFDVLSRQDGMVLPSLEEAREQRMLRVEDGMRRALPPVAKPREIAREVLKLCAGSTDGYVLVSEIDGTWRLVTVEELKRVADRGDGHGIVAEAASSGPVPVVYADQPLEEALRELHDWPLLPVGSRVRTDHIHGVIGLQDVLKAYREN